MSKTSPPRKSVSTPPRATAAAGDAVETFIQARIEAAQAALWRAELSRRLLACVIACLAFALAWLVIDQWIWTAGVTARVLIAAALVIAVIAYSYWRLWPVMHFRIRADYAARALERDHPELGHSLSSYVSLKQQQAAHPGGMLADRVIQSVGAGAAAKLNRIDALPSEATGLFSWWAATIGLIAAIAIYSLLSPKNSLQSLTRLARPMAPIAAPARVRISDVSPGDTETLAGRTLEVQATVKNLRKDEPVFFRWDSKSKPDSFERPGSAASPNSQARDSTATQPIRLNLDPSNLERDRYVASVPISHRAHGTQRYQIVAGDAEAGPFEVAIQDTPVVQIREIAYSPPAYTGKTSYATRSGSIQGIDGTRVALSAEVNRPISRAKIEFNPRKIGQEIQATAGVIDMKVSADGKRIEHFFHLRSRAHAGGVELQDYRIRVWDDVGQSNDDPIVYPIQVVEDLPPEIAIVVPQKSPKDVPLDAEQRFEIHASDVDFGLTKVEIEIHRGIDLLARSTLWEEPAGKQGTQVVEYRFQPSRMIVAGRAQPGAARRGSGLNVGDKIEVVAIATDNRTDPNDHTIVPGVTKTPPVVLRITAAENNSPSSPNSSEEGQQAQRDQKGGGQEEEGGEGQQGEGHQGEGQQGEGQQGEGQQGEGQQGEGQQGEGQQGEGQQGEGQQGEGQQGEGMQEEGQKGEGQQGAGEQAEGQQGAGEQGAGQSANDQQAMESQSEGSGGQQQSGQQEGGQRDEGAQQEAMQDGSGQPGDSSTEEQGANSNADQNQQNGQRKPDSAPQSPARPPEDDAEAFERIQEFLNEQKSKKNDPGAAGDTDSRQQPMDAQESGGDAAGGDALQNAESQSENGERQGEENQAGEGSSPEDSAAKMQAAPDDAQAGEEGEPSSAAPDDGDQQAEATNAEGSEQSDPASKETHSDAGKPGQQGSEPADANEEASKSSDEAMEEDASKEGSSADQSSAQAEPQSAAENARKPESSPTGESDDESESRADESADAASPAEQGGSPSGQPPSGSEKGPSGSASEGGGVGQTGSGEGEELPIQSDLPDPVDLDYTRKATDLVLDYLDETRTDPDPDLLDRLKWSEQDLQRFRERWQSIKPIDDGPRPDQPNASEMEEALRSLGMRPPESARSSRHDASDDLQRLRDAGNRRPAPAGIRDAFEAFRRGLSQPRSAN